MNALRRVGVCFAGLMLGAAAWSVHAAVTCSVSVTSMTISYDPTSTSDPVVTGSYTVSCTRLASDPNTFNWSLGADNGQQPSGATNRVALSGNYYSYELYRTAPYTNANRWQDNNASARIIGTLGFGAQLTASQSGPFDLRLAGPQTVRPAGIYTDLVTATVRNASTSAMLSQSTFSVSVITIAACTLISPPGSVNLAYTSFQPGPAAASTAFGVTCTTATPYTMSLDATSGTLLGLSYSLSLSQSGGTGTGGTQTYSVNGSIAGGQAGTCSSASCSASQTRTLTITY
jgi:hypothetical protein